MPIDHKDEYASLRQEMLDRFNRIHDTVKYGAGAFLIALSYFYIEDKFDGFVALTILQLLIAGVGLYNLRLFHSIYNMGSYIAVFIETNSNEAKWHTMSRELHKSNTDSKSLKWGDDSKYTSGVLIGFMVLAIGAVLSKPEFISTLSNMDESQKFLLGFSLVLIIINSYVIWQLFYDMKNYMINNVDKWKKYQQEILSETSKKDSNSG